MALQSPFFGKRDADHAAARPSHTSGGGSGTASASHNANTPAPGVALSASCGPAPASSLSSGTSVPSSLTRGSQPATQAAVPAAAEASPAKLTVGPNIKLKGVEITDCDTLVVEGTVEATMDSRVIQIAEQGAFRGAAEIDIAEIRGEFSGTLTARHKLVIHGTGKVSGKVRYGKLVIEEGGQLSGEVEMGTGAALTRARPEPASALAA